MAVRELCTNHHGLVKGGPHDFELYTEQEELAED